MICQIIIMYRKDVNMKLKVGVFFGGKSVEHEVSIITALQAIENMDKEKYDVLPIYISKDNKIVILPEQLEGQLLIPLRITRRE